MRSGRERPHQMPHPAGPVDIPLDQIRRQRRKRFQLERKERAAVPRHVYPSLMLTWINQPVLDRAREDPSLLGEAHTHTHKYTHTHTINLPGLQIWGSHVILQGFITFPTQTNNLICRKPLSVAMRTRHVCSFQALWGKESEFRLSSGNLFVPSLGTIPRDPSVAGLRRRVEAALKARRAQLRLRDANHRAARPLMMAVNKVSPCPHFRRKGGMSHMIHKIITKKQSQAEALARVRRLAC